MFADMNFTLSNVRQVIPGYAVFSVYGLATIGLSHTQGVLSPALGVKATSMASILGATVIALPFYIFKSLVVRVAPFLAYGYDRLTILISTSVKTLLQYHTVPYSPYLLCLFRCYI